MKTLREARRELRAQLDEGVTCRCCGQLAKRYRRKLNANMIRFLISLCREHLRSRGWVHKRLCEYTGHDYPYLAFWGLAETRPSDDTSKKSSGYWRPTELGVDFVRGRVSVQSHALIYNNTLDGFDGSEVYVEDVLEEFFDFDELMKGR